MEGETEMSASKANREAIQFQRKHQELPADAPLASIDGFIWSRLEHTQTAESLISVTGLPPAQVKESVKKLIELGLVAVIGADTPRPASNTPASSSGESRSALRLHDAIKLGHRVLDVCSADVHWPEATRSREEAFSTYRRMTNRWQKDLAGLRGEVRVDGEKLLSRLRRVRDGSRNLTEHDSGASSAHRCLWLLPLEEFERHATALSGKSESTGAESPPTHRPSTPVGKTASTKPPSRSAAPKRRDDQAKREEMARRRAEIEARRLDSMKTPGSVSQKIPVEPSGSHKVAGLDAAALYNKAVQAFNEGLVEESARAIQLALAMTPNDEKLLALDAEVSSEWKRSRAHKLAKEAEKDWGIGLIEPAVHKIVEAADLVPDYASICAQAADYCLLTGKLDLAVEFADRAVVNAPGRLDYRLAAAASFFAVGDSMVGQEHLNLAKEMIRDIESRPDD